MKTVCSDGFLSIHSDAPYPLPHGLTITKGGDKIIGHLLPEAFATMTTQTMIKLFNNETRSHEEQCLLGWVQSCMFKHNDGEMAWSVILIDKILIAGHKASCQRLIWINGSRHLRIFKV